MPILKVMFDHKLDQKVDLIAQDLIDSFTQVLADVLESKRATPQVLLMTGNWLSSDFPIYVELQFRDIPVRNEAKAAQVLDIVGSRLFSEFGVGVRSRSFAINERTLVALDITPGTNAICKTL